MKGSEDMGSAFFEYGIGVSGLIASQRNLAVTSNNITNANTEGYSRQQTVQRATRALTAAGKGMIGTGTEVVSVGRVRDAYIDTEFRIQNNKLSEYKTKSEEMTQIANLFNEPSDTGINSVINSVFAAFQDLSINASDASYFENAKQSVNTLLETINIMGESLASQQSLINDEVSYTVDMINSIAKQVQALNIQINKLEVNGVEASSLRDDRDLLIDQLSEYVNVEVTEDLVPGTTDNYKYTVKINGQELVHHDRVNLLTVIKNEGFQNPEDQDVLYNIAWEKGYDFNEYSSTLTGKLKSLIEVRDGNGGNQLKGTIKEEPQIDANGIVTVTLSGVNRGDIGDSGIITITGKDYLYSHTDYNEDTNELTVVLSDKTQLPVGIREGDAARVGTNLEYRGIPYYVNKLNEFVRTLAGALNEGIYRDGSKIEGITGSCNGYTQAGETGISIITYKDEKENILGKNNEVDYEKMNIYNMSLSKELLESAKNIAISKESNPSESQLDMILEITSLAHKNVFKEGEVSDFMSAIISEVAMDVNQADKYKAIQENLTLYTENKRSSVSGVVNNEEMTNLVKFQSTYKASAKIINVMSEVYDTLINGIFS